MSSLTMLLFLSRFDVHHPARTELSQRRADAWCRRSLLLRRRIAGHDLPSDNNLSARDRLKSFHERHDGAGRGVLLVLTAFMTTTTMMIEKEAWSVSLVEKTCNCIGYGELATVGVDVRH